MTGFECGFIGCGSMGGALLRASARAIDPSRIAVMNRTQAKAEAIAAETGARAVALEELVMSSRFIFLGVKPQLLPALSRQLSPMLCERGRGFVLVTMAAGVTMQSLCALLHGDFPVIRIMPNTPVAVGEGMILYSKNELVSDAQLQGFLALMSDAGRLDRLDESLIDAASAVSGSGPAYAYMFAEALADGGVQCGLPRAKAMTYAAQMLLGSAKLLLESGKHPGELKDAVCSPGGATIEGVHELDRAAFRGAASEAVIAAYKKTQKLGVK